SDDLCKLVNGEQQNGDCASQLLKDEYNGDESNPGILIDHNEILVRIYEKAIENFFDTQKQKV
ncbi:hypothetical protein, partial [Enterobacter roggenkampii]|uniref:hypothetical protein n=1 Tax=Enterobacter roggenkampii TaxID=1812935 RepID=UPI001402890D